jgi:DNA-binding transcriptional MerR regulator
MSDYLLISDAAKEVNVENHVLRYWEEELHLPIKRNELGHRYYTREDVERFRQIKDMKERGLQLKAIKMILKNGKLDVLADGGEQGIEVEKERETSDGMPIHIVNAEPVSVPECREIVPEDKEDKSRRLQWLLQQLIRETLQENNQQLCKDIKESVIKELDYQFRMVEEREEQREQRQNQRSEEYYKKMDELLRKKSKRRRKAEGRTTASRPESSHSRIPA